MARKVPLQPLLNDLADRLERGQDCFSSLAGLFQQFNAACANREWAEAERLRQVIIDTVDGALDAVAAIFKRIEGHGEKT